MVPLHENEIPQMPGASRGKKSKLVNPSDVKLSGATPLAKGAIIEFLDKCLTCETEGDVEGKTFSSILMSINGKPRWMGSGTFTQVDWCGTRQLVSPEVGQEARRYADVQSLWEGMNTRKMKVVDILHTRKQMWENGVLTDKTEPASYPVLAFVD